MRLLKPSFYLYVSWTLILAGFAPSAYGRRSSPCEIMLALIERQQLLLGTTAPGPQAKIDDQAIALFKSLPQPILAKYQDAIMKYLIDKSRRKDAPKVLAAVHAAFYPKQAPLADATILKIASSKADNKTEFAIRMHPSLQELQKLFDVAGVQDDYDRSEADVRQIIEELKDLKDVEKQVVIRHALQDIDDSSPSNNFSSYAYTILLQAGQQMASGDGIDKMARQMADDLGKLVTGDDLFFNSKLAKEQLAEVVMRTFGNNQLERQQAYLALKNAFLTVNFKPRVGTWVSNIIAGVTIGGMYLYNYLTSSAWDPSSYYAFDHELMLAWVSALGTKVLLNYLAVRSEGLHPTIGYDKKTEMRIRYLEQDTKDWSQLLLVQLQHKIMAVRTLLVRGNNAAAPQASVAPPAAAPATAAPQPPVDEELKSAVATPPAPAPKEATPPPPPVTVEETKQKLERLPKLPSTRITASPDVRSAAQLFDAYFTECQHRVAERDLLIEHMAIGYLMPKTANIQVVGESGIGKTAVPRLVMIGILDENNKPSYKKIQMGTNTTIDDLLGTVKPSKLKEDIIERASENALPGSQSVQITEYFRGPIHTRQDLLSFQLDGTVEASNVTFTSKNRMIIYDSNKYPNEVFKRDGDEARAEYDRTLYTHVVTPILEKDEHMIEMEDIDETNLPELHYSDIDVLRSFTATMKLDRYYRTRIKLLINRLRLKVMKEEHDSIMDNNRRLMSGEVLLTSPEFRTRVLSPRSEHVAYKLIRRYAVMRWIKSGSPEPGPDVTEADFARLSEFFLPNSSPDEHLDRVMREYSEGSVQQQQFQMIKKSRRDFKAEEDGIESDVNSDRLILSLQRMLPELGVSLEALNASAPVRVPVSSRNAAAVNEFLNWYEMLRKEVNNRGEVVETTVHNLAQDKAMYLAKKILGLLRS